MKKIHIPIDSAQTAIGLDNAEIRGLSKESALASSTAIAISVVVIADAFFFAFFIQAQSLFQSNAPIRTAFVQSHLKADWTALATVFLAIGTLLLFREKVDYTALRRGGLAIKGVWWAFGGGIGFTVIKALDWWLLAGQGVTLQAGPVDAIHYLIEGAFLLHLLVGLGFLAHFSYYLHQPGKQTMARVSGFHATRIWLNYLTVMWLVIFAHQYITNSNGIS